MAYQGSPLWMKVYVGHLIKAILSKGKFMKSVFCLIEYISLFLLLTLLLFTGCRRDDHSISGALPAVDVSVSPPVNAADPCTIALTPHTGTDRIDQQIIHLQQKARCAEEPWRTAYLERLGWAFVTKARISFDPGFYKLAEQCALCVESKEPHSAEAMLLRGHVLHNLHQFKEGEALARELVAQRGLSFDHGLLGDLLMEQGKLDEAIDAYQKMMDQKPGPQAYSRTAHVRWLKGDLQGAIAVMEMATGASSSRDHESAAWAYVRLALYEMQAGNISKASDIIETALALQPDYPPALLARGRMLLAKGKNTEAIVPLTRATQLNPLPEHQWGLIEALRTAGHRDKAGQVEKQLMQRGASDDPRTFALYLATIGHDTKMALLLSEEELKVRADIFTLDTLAWALRAVGRIQEARSFSERALAEGTQDARLFYHAGVIAAAAGQHKEAEVWFEKTTAIQHMLLPSEREHLFKETAALQAQKSILTSGQSN
ncbi:MAG: tetratricopeptide repeat protein [Candidatus Brocadia sp.]|nr:tetratricopeptide repeat protein [Candidatus Brocadia sp.]